MKKLILLSILSYSKCLLAQNVGVGTNTPHPSAQLDIIHSSKTLIGNTSTVSIGGYVNGTNISDGRYKKNIREDVKGLEFIMKLRPVTYQLDVLALNSHQHKGQKTNNEYMTTAMIEKEKQIQTGFIAQEVEVAAKELDYDFSGVDKPKNENDVYGLRYAEFVVPLVKAIQEQQQIIDEMKRSNDALQKDNQLQTSLIEDLMRRIKKLESQFLTVNEF